MRRLPWTFLSHGVAIFAVLSALWARPGHCQKTKDARFAFTNPSGPDLSKEKNYTIGETQRATWNATYSIISLSLCYDLDNLCSNLARNQTNAQGWEWKVNTTRSLVGQPRFYLTLWNATGNEYIRSPFFFIYPADSSQPSSTTTRTSTATATAISTSTGGSRSLILSSNSRGSRGLSTGAKIGMGVGIPAAFLLGCGLVFVALVAWRRRRKAAAGQVPEQAYHPVWPGDGMTHTTSHPSYMGPASSTSTGYKDPSSSTATSELPNRDPGELQAGNPPVQLP
ncbi:MAG: hypothetical protein M1823_002764 [Watsoniomyces obsoletus]|nr:MAG: hypothetical protein M1823_002764 [Watsoniomyces obsoletus]